MVVHTEWWLAVRADVRFETLANQLGGGNGGVKGLVGYAGLSSWPWLKTGVELTEFGTSRGLSQGFQAIMPSETPQPVRR